MIRIKYNECTLYFAVDCEWQPARVFSDCQKHQDAYFNETESETESDSESEPMPYCFELTSIEGLKEHEAKSVIEEVKERMKNKEVFEFSDDNPAPKFLQKKIDRICNKGSTSM